MNDFCLNIIIRHHTSLTYVSLIFHSALDTVQKRIIYQLSDGNKTIFEIAKAASASDHTIRRYWETWARQGIVESLKVRGGERYKKTFELEDFGIEVSQVIKEKDVSNQKKMEASAK